MSNSTANMTYDAIGNREDLLNVITNIAPLETPMFSSFGRSKAKAVTHDWLTDTLAPATTNAKIEGANYNFAARGVRTRLSNYTQIFQTPVEVSDTQREVDTAGIEDEFSYQMAKAMKEHARDIEYAFVNGTGNTGGTGAARSLKGVLAWITTNVVTGTGTGAEDLTEDMFNDCLQKIWNEGGMPDTAYANGFNKRQISAFTGGATKNVDTEPKAVFQGVDVYDSDFGRIRIVADRYMTTSVVAILENSKWKTAILRPTKRVDVAKVGSATRAVIESELTLEALSEAASGQIPGLSTS
jgi:hypothetical protein